MHYLYRITNLINSKIYIGQSISPNKRWAAHKHQAKQVNPNQLISKSINKYGVENFSFEVIATCKSYEDANYIEEQLIKQYNCLVNDGYGYNLSLGGEVAPKSEDFKRKVSAKLMGHPVSEETLRKQSQSHMGQIPSESTRKAVSKAAKGNKHRQGLEPWNKKFSSEEELIIAKDSRSSRVLAKEFKVNKSTILDIRKRNNK
jgi:group I intron endonuclease